MEQKQEEQEIAKDGMIGAIPVNLKLSEVIDMKSDAMEIAKLREDAVEQFNLDELKEKYKKRILGSSEFRKDSNLTEADAELVAQQKIDSFYEFKPVDDLDSLSTKLARVYVRRRKIAKKYGVPILAASILGVVVWGSSVAVNNWRVWSAERSVETAVEENYRTKESLVNQINSLESNKTVLKDADELVALIRSSEDELERTNDFFNKYCDEGTADDNIDQQNYSEAKQNLQSVEEILASVKQKVNKGEGLVRFEQDLTSTRQSLDSLIKEIESSTPPKVLMTRASTVYNSGVASLDNRQLDQARQYRDELREVKNNVKEFETLPDKLEQVYSSINQIAKEQIAVQQANVLHNNGLNYVNNVDIPLLKQTVSKLEELSAVLNQEYKLRIVSREDVSSGVERGYNNLPSNYYVIVEAIDSNGNVLTKRITSEEDGNTKDVNFWGEKVPLAVFERVKDDKLDDGIIQDNIFAKKEIGYLSEEIALAGVTGRAQITEWDE